MFEKLIRKKNPLFKENNESGSNGNNESIENNGNYFFGQPNVKQEPHTFNPTTGYIPVSNQSPNPDTVGYVKIGTEIFSNIDILYLCRNGKKVLHNGKPCIKFNNNDYIMINKDLKIIKSEEGKGEGEGEELIECSKNRSNTKTKQFLQNFLENRSNTKTKQFLQNFLENGIENLFDTQIKIKIEYYFREDPEDRNYQGFFIKDLFFDDGSLFYNGKSNNCMLLDNNLNIHLPSEIDYQYVYNNTISPKYFKSIKKVLHNFNLKKKSKTTLSKYKQCSHKIKSFFQNSSITGGSRKKLRKKNKSNKRKTNNRKIKSKGGKSKKIRKRNNKKKSHKKK